MTCTELCGELDVILSEKGNGYLILDNGSCDFIVVKDVKLLVTSNSVKIRVENVEEKMIPVHIGELICSLRKYGETELKLYSKMSEYDLYEDDFSDMEIRIGGVKDV